MPFKFIVEDTSYYVHRELVAQYSAPLERMMNGEMKEAQESCATLEDVEKGTFLRFVEFLYDGYYTPAEPITRSGSPEPRDLIDDDNDTTIATDITAWSTPLPQRSLPWPGPGTSEKEASGQPRSGILTTMGQHTTRAAAKASFSSRQDRASVRKHVKEAPQPRANKSDQEDYSEVFLSHARLYVFANMYQIAILKTLALEELEATLAVFKLHRKRVRDIVALLQYFYAETTSSTSEEVSLKDVMQHYVATEMETLIKNKYFRNLIIEDGGPLLGDVMTVVGRRLA